VVSYRNFYLSRQNPSSKLPRVQSDKSGFAADRARLPPSGADPGDATSRAAAKSRRVFGWFA
jgi:hypothetical protein